MLSIHFLNDATGTEEIGHYKWIVRVNDVTLASGDLTNHKRSKGWEGLIKLFVRKELDKAR